MTSRSTRNRFLAAGLAAAVAVLASACCVCPEPMYATAYWEPTAVVVPHAPPPPKVTAVAVASPAPSYIWIEGYWDWTGYDYIWIEGYWTPPREGGAWDSFCCRSTGSGKRRRSRPTPIWFVRCAVIWRSRSSSRGCRPSSSARNAWRRSARPSQGWRTV